MKLCRTVTLTSERKLSHAISPLASLESATYQILAGPVKLSFDSYRLAALIEDPAILSPDFHFADDTKITWSLLISEQMDKKPLFSNMSQARALLLLGEVATHLFEGFEVFGHHLERVVPNTVTDHLVLNYVVEKGSSARAAIGAALCLTTMLDGLLFVRGLTITSSKVSIIDEAKLERAEFVNLYRFVMTDIYDH